MDNTLILKHFPEELMADKKIEYNECFVFMVSGASGVNRQSSLMNVVLSRSCTEANEMSSKGAGVEKGQIFLRIDLVQKQ